MMQLTSLDKVTYNTVPAGLATAGLAVVHDIVRDQEEGLELKKKKKSQRTSKTRIHTIRRKEDEKKGERLMRCDITFLSFLTRLPLNLYFCFSHHLNPMAQKIIRLFSFRIIFLFLIRSLSFSRSFQVVRCSYRLSGIALLCLPTQCTSPRGWP